MEEALKGIEYIEIDGVRLTTIEILEQIKTNKLV